MKTLKPVVKISETVSINFETGFVYWDKEDSSNIELTKQELKIMTFLCKQYHNGREGHVSNREIFKYVYGYSYNSDKDDMRPITRAVSKLRGKETKRFRMDEIIESDNRGNYWIDLCESPFVENESLSPVSKAVPQTETDDSAKADNQAYLAHFTEPLFLEKEDVSKVTLASMYVSPHLKNKDEGVAECIMQWFDSSTRKTCMLLFGNAGVGKSSLVSKIIADAYSITQDEDKEFQLSSDQVLAVALRNHYDKIDMSKDADEILSDLFSGYSKEQLKNKLLILDGLDEVCVLLKDFDGHEFLEMLMELDQGFHVLVTSRDAKDYFSDPSNIKNLEIEELEWIDNEVETWCSKYCNAKEGKITWCNRFKRDYKAFLNPDENDHRKEAFCVPIILYICGESGIKLSDHTSIGSIYGDAFQKILSREHLKGKRKIKLKKADKRTNLIAWQYTKEIAYQMFLLDTLDLADSNISDNKHAIGLKNAKERTKTILQDKYGIDVPDNALELKKELALCPFTRTNGTGGITFAHKTVYEYFTAVKLYEDYFAKFNKSYFDNPDKSAKAAEDVIMAAIDAFRNKAIPEDIFHYLYEMKYAPFNENEESAVDDVLDVKRFTEAFVQAMEDRVLDKIAPTVPITEYLTSQYTYNKCNTQITRAFRALLCFLTGHGFRNENGSEACKQICDMLVKSNQIVNLEQWDLQGSNLQGANLFRAKLQRTNLFRAKLFRANLQEAKYCTDPQMATIFPAGFNAKEHGMIEVDRYGNPITTDTTQS